MNLTELKNTPVSELITLGENMGLENQARMRKQDIIFAILKQHAKSGEDIFGDGALDPLPKSAVSTSALVTPFQVRFVLQKRVNATLRC